MPRACISMPRRSTSSVPWVLLVLVPALLATTWAENSTNSTAGPAQAVSNGTNATTAASNATATVVASTTELASLATTYGSTTLASSTATVPDPNLPHYSTCPGRTLIRVTNGSVGQILSSQYPKVKQYAANVTCEWIIEGECLLHCLRRESGH